MAAMGSKSREVIYSGRIIGAKIRADGAVKPRRRPSVRPTERRPSWRESATPRLHPQVPSFGALYRVLPLPVCLLLFLGILRL
jgi:hypothetical protein